MKLTPEAAIIWLITVLVLLWGFIGIVILGLEFGVFSAE